MTQYKFEPSNFMDLLKDENSTDLKSITIPLIQRDYAQGRKKESVIANNFLNDISTFLESNDPEMYLDFVYGTEKDNDFIPLDGQQRLTTLFLLHWYSNNKNKNSNDDLNRFSYDVRDTSKDFLNVLTTHNMDITTINGDLSKWIINQNWFFNSWKKDPTIDAILNMLDKIHIKFKACDSLTQENLNKIKFSLLNLKDFKLTDELYIKMNGRGRPLTEFENFKAIFGKYLISDDQIKLDNEWFDIFWDLATEDAKDNKKINIPNLAGEKFFNFFHNISYCLYVKNHEQEADKNWWEDFNLVRQCQELYTNNEDKDNYNKNTTFIVNLLDRLAIKNKEEHTIFLEDFKDLQFTSTNISYQNLVKFYSLSLIYASDTENKKHKEFKRVSYNLIHNQIIENANIKTIIDIQKLFFDKTKNQNVYEYITSNNLLYKEYTYTKEQIEEEIEKAKIIIENSKLEWEKEFITAENNYYLKGQISFLIRFADKELDQFINYRDRFIKLWHLAEEFSTEEEKSHFKNQCNQNLIRGALLTLTQNGKFYMPNSDNKHLLCGFDNALQYKNAGWRKVFNETDNNYIKILLDQINNTDIKSQLTTLIQNYKKSPKEKLVTYMLKTIKEGIIKEDAGYSYFMNYGNSPNKLLYIDKYNVYKLGSTKNTPNKLELFNIALSTEEFYTDNGHWSIIHNDDSKLPPFTRIYNHHEYLVLTQGKEIILDIYYNEKHNEETEPCFTLDLFSRGQEFKFINKKDKFKDLEGVTLKELTLEEFSQNSENLEEMQIIFEIKKDNHEIIKFYNIPYSKVKLLVEKIANKLHELEK